jgi:hypothetical protein
VPRCASGHEADGRKSRSNVLENASGWKGSPTGRQNLVSEAEDLRAATAAAARTGAARDGRRIVLHR